MHPRPEGVEDPSDSDGDVVLTVEIEEKRLCHPLPLVVASSDAYYTNSTQPDDS